MKKETLISASADSAFNFRLEYSDYPIPHTHDFWEFMLITNGAYSHKINGKNIEIRKNVLCLIRPSDKHSIEKLTEEVSHINFTVPDDIMHTQLDIIMHGGGLYKKIIGSEPVFLKFPKERSSNIWEYAPGSNFWMPDRYNGNTPCLRCF